MWHLAYAQKRMYLYYMRIQHNSRIIDISPTQPSTYLGAFPNWGKLTVVLPNVHCRVWGRIV